MKENKYEKPQLRMLGLELENFVCASIQAMTMFIEVEDYENLDSEDLYFD